MIAKEIRKTFLEKLEIKIDLKVQQCLSIEIAWREILFSNLLKILYRLLLKELLNYFGFVYHKRKNY